MQSACPFCNTHDALLVNSLAYVRPDKYPVTPGHLLVIPLRHEANFFATSPDELKAVWELVTRARELVDRQYHPDGYNLGINVGEAAGQTIAHAHVHLIPRYRGDMKNPRGGVRGVIPGKQQYEPGRTVQSATRRTPRWVLAEQRFRPYSAPREMAFSPNNNRLIG